MTSQFSFPPPTFALQPANAETGNAASAGTGNSLAQQDHIRATELQMAQVEKQEILVYEGYLAKNDITEANSLLLSQLISLDPKGECALCKEVLFDII